MIIAAISALGLILSVVIPEYLKVKNAFSTEVVGQAGVILAIFSVLSVLVFHLTRNIDLARDKAEESRRQAQSREFLQSVIDSLPDELMVLNPDMDILLANRNVREQFGNDPVALGMKCFQVSHRSEKACTGDEDRCPLVEARDMKKPVTFTHRHPCGEGGFHFVEVTASPVLDDSGEVVQIIENCRDVTERIHTQEAIKQANDELTAKNRKLKLARDEAKQLAQAADQANQAKSAFLANMSHEIRTPLTAVLGYTELLAEDLPEGSTSQDTLGVIKRNGEHLLSLINTILDLSKIESGQEVVELQPTDPSGMVEEIAQLARCRIQEKGLDFSLNYLTPMPRIIQSDPTRLKQALINLLCNAVKFTDKGQVKLDVAFRQQGEKPGGMMEFTITDSGMGMDEDTLARIFQPFNQGDTSITRKFGGTGLGLTITQGLARLLGGEVQVNSSPGQGSAFTLTVATGQLQDSKLLDMAEGKLQANPGPLTQTTVPVVSLDGLKILYAEDARDNQILVTRMLERAGAQVEIAENGQLAVDRLEEAEFDLILMDQMMPVMGGEEATRLIREAGNPVPIVALSANAMEKDQKASLAAGCDAYLTKPINRKALLKTVSELAVPIPS